MKVFSTVVGIGCILLASCKNSPSTHVAGTYNGNYLVDSVAPGTATATIVEVNSLTVNINMDFQTHSDFSMNNVEVNGDGDVYNLHYTGLQGSMDGSVNTDHLSFILVSTVDTVYFQGNR